MKLCFVLFSVNSKSLLRHSGAPWKKEFWDQSLTQPSRWRTPQMPDSRGWWPLVHQHRRWTPHRTEPLVFRLLPLVCQSRLYTCDQEVWETLRQKFLIFVVIFVSSRCLVRSLPDQTQRVLSDVDQTPQSFHRLVGCGRHVWELVKQQQQHERRYFSWNLWDGLTDLISTE